MLNAFTVDVEDYYHVSGFTDRITHHQWDGYESRVVRNTQRVLRLLERFETPATFFVLGWVADRFPQLVRDIQSAGHEIGCHSYWHRLVYDMCPDEFQLDLALSCDTLQQITGTRIVAYRAPSFSITKRSLWAVDVLLEQGVRYDSSVFPVRHDRYGIPDAPRFPHKIHRPAGELWEFPGAVRRLWGSHVPVGGGGYFRLYPLALTRRWLRHINDQEQQPFMFYIHPWELDSDQPRLPGSLRSRLRHYVNLGSTEAKLEQLLTAFSFGTLSEVLEGRQRSMAPASPAGCTDSEHSSRPAAEATILN
ncbi:MAG: DUF3473 domain-containing protein [Planctomycetes bacterium]|nr:DUF3473 domain-containing protein [Planctomycetota bacterium]